WHVNAAKSHVKCPFPHVNSSKWHVNGRNPHVNRPTLQVTRSIQAKGNDPLQPQKTASLALSNNESGEYNNLLLILSAAGTVQAKMEF
ncbi:hypothetical protein, partial [Fictibacillus terranigra]|uniref:hypothetical protein n=1 Tax=Fictibacillus terranigra TaxID=3058424 RepID=UPI0025B67E86